MSLVKWFCKKLNDDNIDLDYGDKVYYTRHYHEKENII